MRVILQDLDGEVVERGVADGVWTAEPAGEVLDLSAFACLPGLADGHSHLGGDDMATLGPGDPVEVARRAFHAVERGVFLVFDKGWSDTAVITLRDVPPVDRPHVRAAGRIISAEAGYYPDFAVEVDEAGLADAVRRTAAEAAGWVKIVGDWPRRGIGPVANFGKSALTAAVEAAHAVGARVAVHTMAPEVASVAVRAGVDSIEHGLFLTDDDIRVLGARSGMWVPTILRMEEVVAQFGPERTGARIVAEGLDRVRSLLPGAQAAGVRVLAGTDLAVPTGDVAAEAGRLVEYGLTPSQAVEAVSLGAWSAGGLGRPFAVGAEADLVAFRRDPRHDIAELARPVALIRAGRVSRRL
ncbi:MAG TPA: amidohydrolase family protein [Acidimicrobiia bacterium]|nr:amidohydrolase family protein [Acidimicrobiia bacterium]